METNPRPMMDPFQVEVKQSTDRATGRETVDPVHPLTVFESLPGLGDNDFGDGTVRLVRPLKPSLVQALYGF